jgi:16S rRNA (guanine527-N7)-methyltransferase
MNIETIARLLAPYASIDEQRLQLTSIYIDILLKWNARINLTAVRAPEEIVTRHFGESFFAAEFLKQSGIPETAIDLGSGAGFPGIPLAISMPETRVTLIESNQKKATFLREVSHSLGLKNVSIFIGRGEQYTGRAALVTMRAVERFERALPTAIALAEPGARVALMIGAAQVAQAVALGKGIEWDSPVAVPGGYSRTLLVGTRNAKVE